MSTTAILWLRRDLRLADHPALTAALAAADAILPLYIHAPEEECPWSMGGASRWWLHGSLSALDLALRERGSQLAIARGPSLDTLCAVAESIGARQVFWSRLYDPATRGRDTRIKLALRARGIAASSLNASLLREPWEVQSEGRRPYRVYSAFRRRIARDFPIVDAPLPAPTRLPTPPDYPSLGVDALGLLPRIPWDLGLAAHWRPGEASALAQTRAFVAGALDGYGERRDRPGVAGTSRLSPHLHFGEIGPRQVLDLIRLGHGSLETPAAEPFVAELLWREFAYHLIYHFPETPEAPLDPRFARFPWRIEGAAGPLRAWQRGRTGIPLVDAGMRELWRTGWMHNRVRMTAASFLTKNLLIPWQEGARWFWDTLVDADLAANTLGWQWTAGCGADAAPYFRVFNPVRQGERFDPDGAYVRRWCPELARLPDRWIHQPWAAPDPVLAAAGIALGRDYPRPIVDLARSRLEALAAFETLKGRDPTRPASPLDGH
jgi:deoxyribodipyrimidine photo-lyase